jgi:hypothetical protein
VNTNSTDLVKIKLGDLTGTEGVVAVFQEKLHIDQGLVAI